MFCPKCGTQLPDGAAFCSKCGAQLGGNNGNTISSINNEVVDYDNLSIEVLTVKAQAGDADAMVALAFKFTEQQTEDSKKKAFVLYQNAVNLGSIQGKIGLATAYQEGIGTIEDNVKAKCLLKEVIDSGAISDAELLCVVYFRYAICIEEQDSDNYLQYLEKAWTYSSNMPDNEFKFWLCIRIAESVSSKDYYPKAYNMLNSNPSLQIKPDDKADLYLKMGECADVKAKQLEWMNLASTVMGISNAKKGEIYREIGFVINESYALWDNWVFLLPNDSKNGANGYPYFVKATSLGDTKAAVVLGVVYENFGSKNQKRYFDYARTKGGEDEIIVIGDYLQENNPKNNSQNSGCVVMLPIIGIGFASLVGFAVCCLC